MDDILFLSPVFKTRIWGGQNMKDTFGYDLPDEKTGECWAVSAHPNGSSIIKNGTYQGLTLQEVYAQARHLFGSLKADRFPLLVKIIDAHDDLSVQVHPGDAYARVHAGDLGKSECWVVLDAKPGARIVHGHTAKTKDALRDMIEAGRWADLLIWRTVKPGDFIDVPAGTIHALGKGIMVLEIQQSSDTTYRLYDYDRKDDQGNARALHLDDAIKVANVPHVEPVPDMKALGQGGTQLIDNDYFKVLHWRIDKSYAHHQSSFSLVSVIDGQGAIDGHAIKKGDHLIVTSRLKDFTVTGPVELVIAAVTSQVHKEAST